MLDEIVYLLSSSLFISISLQSTKEENHRAFNESSFESVTDVSNNRHGLPGLIPEHEAIAGLTNPGLSGVFKYPVLSLNVHVPSYPVILYDRGQGLVRNTNSHLGALRPEAILGEHVVLSHVPGKIMETNILLADITI